MTERLIDKMPCNRCANSFSCIKYCNEWIKWYKLCMKKLAEYEAAEEEGRLVILPCNVGDLVFKIFSQRDSFDDSEYDIIMAANFNYTMIPEIGKTVFLTYKEAEKKLEELKHEI